MKSILAIAVLLTSTALAQNAIHITAIHDHIRDKNEQSFSRPLHTREYVGIIGNRIFTLEEGLTAFSKGSHFEVGHDYEVVKVEDRIGKTIKIKEDPDKKGRVMTEWLTVISVEEKVSK